MVQHLSNLQTLISIAASSDSKAKDGEIKYPPPEKHGQDGMAFELKYPLAPTGDSDNIVASLFNTGNMHKVKPRPARVERALALLREELGLGELPAKWYWDAECGPECVSLSIVYVALSSRRIGPDMSARLLNTTLRRAVIDDV